MLETQFEDTKNMYYLYLKCITVLMMTLFFLGLLFDPASADHSLQLLSYMLHNVLKTLLMVSVLSSACNMYPHSISVAAACVGAMCVRASTTFVHHQCRARVVR